MNQADTISHLECLLNEFYHHTTSNFRKKEIEKDLKSFQSLDDSWKIIQSLIQSSHNQFLWFFSTSTVELTITKKWSKLNPNSKVLIRDYLWHVYSNYPMNIGAMQRDKLSQLIALIGKRQFPDEWPTFVTQILELMKNKFILGVTLLKAAFNEITSTKPDVPFQRKKNFTQGINLCLAEIIPLLNKFLTLCVCRVSNNELVLGLNDEFMNIALPNDDRFVSCCTELLSCISNMFSWAPTHDMKLFNSEFFNNIFELCMHNGEAYVNINIIALVTVSELFYLQKPLPQPQIQANGITELIQQNLSNAYEEYQDKLTELLKLFIAQQWNRCVSSQDFPSRDFLLYLFNFTFTSGISSLTFTDRLSAWKPIIKSFNEKAAGRYTETLVQLISNVYKKMQFQFDSELDLLDTEELDENMQTELQAYLNQCVEIITTAAEVEPCKIYDLINSDLNRDDGKFKSYVTILNTLPDEVPKIPVNINDLMRCYTHEPSKAYFMHCLIRDLSSLLQTVTQLSSVVSLTTEERSNSISMTIRSFIFAFKISNRKKLHLYNFENLQVTSDLVELQAQFLTSLRNMIMLRCEVYEDYEEIFNLITCLSDILLSTEEPSVVRNSAAQLLMTITSGIRPSFVLKNPSILKLIQNELNNHHDHQLRLNIKRIILNILILPYNKIAINQFEEQEYQKRGNLAIEYITFSSQKFLAMKEESEFLEIDDLADYEELLIIFEDTNTCSKQILHAAIQQIINKSIDVLQKFGKNPKVYEMIVNFFLSAVRCLQVQIGNDFVVQIIRLFLDMAKITNGNAQALNKLLQMLIFIVKQSGPCLLLSDILKMCMGELLTLERTQSLDISLNLYTLFDEILQNHWNYFQKVQNGVHQEDVLLKIFTAYGQMLCNGTNSQDPNVIRIILNSLEKLNQLWKLYDRAFFQNYLQKSFLVTLIRLVISPGGALFFDQISTILYSMSEKNKTVLQECFTSIGYPSEAKIIQQICETCDLPTFQSNLEILVQDTIYSQFLQ